MTVEEFRDFVLKQFGTDSPIRVEVIKYEPGKRAIDAIREAADADAS